MDNLNFGKNVPTDLRGYRAFKAHLFRDARDGRPEAREVLGKMFRVRVATCPQLKKINQRLKQGALSPCTSWL